MQEGLPLLVHGEVTDSSVDFFDREKVFIEKVLHPLLEAVPSLRVVMEHITTKDAVDFVTSSPLTVAASITPQHILFNRNSLFVGGLRPHSYCLPILKREEHRAAVLEAATSGNPSFFLGTDSAPHERMAKESSCGCAGIFSSPVALPLYAHAFEMAGALENLEAFASFNGPDFYKLPRNTGKTVISCLCSLSSHISKCIYIPIINSHTGTITLRRQDWKVPETIPFGSGVVVPMWAGQECPWKIVAVEA